MFEIEIREDGGDNPLECFETELLPRIWDTLHVVNNRKNINKSDSMKFWQFWVVVEIVHYYEIYGDEYQHNSKTVTHVYVKFE